MDPIQTPLVQTDWLETQLSSENNFSDFRVVDSRWRGDGTSSQALFLSGHIPGAVHLDWQLDLGWTDERGIRDLILPPERFAAVMEAAGIGDETLVIAYADSDYSGAARIWWALRYYGHQNVVVLDGGFDKWLAEGKPVSKGNTDLSAIKNKHKYIFTPKIDSRFLATATEIQTALDQKLEQVKLVDTRPPEQFYGNAVWTPAGSLFLPTNAKTVDIGSRNPIRGGHIPGAINLHASPTFLNQYNWTYLVPAEIKEKAIAAGLSEEQRIITYCGVGISASMGLFGLYLAGFHNIGLYDASWEEWGTDPVFPIVTGTEEA